MKGDQTILISIGFLIIAAGLYIVFTRAASIS